jgi:hypothetical protein
MQRREIRCNEKGAPRRSGQAEFPESREKCVFSPSGVPVTIENPCPVKRLSGFRFGRVAAESEAKNGVGSGIWPRCEITK